MLPNALLCTGRPHLRITSPKRQWYHSWDLFQMLLMLSGHCLASPAPPALQDLDPGSPPSCICPGSLCAELILLVAWMPSGPSHDLKRHFWGVIFISVALLLFPRQLPSCPPSCGMGNTCIVSLVQPWKTPE